MKTAPFTTATWSDFSRLGLTRDSIRDLRYSWTHQSDLADELETLVPITHNHARTIIEATAAGLPVELVFDLTLNGTEIVQRTTAVGIVERLVPSNNVYDGIRFRTWGFVYSIAWDRLRSARVISATYEFNPQGA